MIKHGFAPFLECSSKGDKRFSAFYARIKARGNKTIEEIYQASKVFSDGTTNLSVKNAKGQKAENMDDISKLYSELWNEYFEENPELLKVISKYSGFSDIFGQTGHVCQATEIYRIWIEYQLKNVYTNQEKFDELIGNMSDKDMKPGDVYCGRGQGSIHGNPYSHIPHIIGTYKVNTVEEAVAHYRYSFLVKLRDPVYKQQVLNLKGKKLYCWCKGKNLCHLSVLVSAANLEW